MRSNGAHLSHRSNFRDNFVKRWPIVLTNFHFLLLYFCYSPLGLRAYSAVHVCETILGVAGSDAFVQFSFSTIGFVTV